MTYRAREKRHAGLGHTLNTQAAALVRAPGWEVVGTIHQLAQGMPERGKSASLGVLV